MTVTDCILAIDQGTTTTRAMVFDRAGQEVARAQVELEQHYPHDGWVEHDPDEIWRATLTVCRGGSSKRRAALYDGWRQAVQRVLT